MRSSSNEFDFSEDLNTAVAGFGGGTGAAGVFTGDEAGAGAGVGADAGDEDVTAVEAGAGDDRVGTGGGGFEGGIHEVGLGGGDEAVALAAVGAASTTLPYALEAADTGVTGSLPEAASAVSKMPSIIWAP
jgi:hypothetical protein